MDNYVLGVDYGTDSVRSILVNARDGITLASEVYNYPRWKEGKYCDPTKNQYRQNHKLRGFVSIPLGHLLYR